MPSELESDRSPGPSIPVTNPIGLLMTPSGNALVDALFPSPLHLQMLAGARAGFDSEEKRAPVVNVHLPFCGRALFYRYPFGSQN